MHPPASQKIEQVKDALPVEPEQVAQLAPPVAKHGHAQEKSFAAETAATTGMTKQAINRHIARADALGDDLDRLVGTSLDNALKAARGLHRARCKAGPAASRREADSSPRAPVRKNRTPD